MSKYSAFRAETGSKMTVFMKKNIMVIIHNALYVLESIH